MTKPMMDLPMDTKNKSCSCGGPPEFLETPCPVCGEKGHRVKAGTVRYLLNDDLRTEVADKIYGMCASPECEISWYSQDASHSFTTAQTDTPIWTKKDADPVYACYCNKITREMVQAAVQEHGLRAMDDVILHYRDEIASACAVRNPMGKCCTETFNEMIKEFAG